MTGTFAPADRERLARAREVRIETRAAPDAPAHLTTIWVVVDAAGRVLIRTYRGPTSRWYREALAHPAVRLHGRGLLLDARAVPAADAERIASCSAALRAKYAGDPSTSGMVAEAVLGTTLELVPR